MSDCVVAYVPVLHEGYRRFVDSHARDLPLYLIGPELYQDRLPLAKDIRALPAELAARSIAAWGVCSQVSVLNEAGAKELAAQSPRIVMPAEDVSFSVVERFFGRCEVFYDAVFLRWDKTRTALLLKPDARNLVDSEELTTAFRGDVPKAAEQLISALDEENAERMGQLRLDFTAMMEAANKASAESIDWWRQVGAAMRLSDGEVMSATNVHSPRPSSPYAAGDPRANFFKGVSLQLSTATHAEAALIAQAAREGKSTRKAVMFVTDFPCPPCAKLIAGAGIAKLYYVKGYAVLDGQDVLEAAEVEIVRVNRPDP